MSDGVVYLLHFSGPVAPGRHTCQYYLGYAGRPGLADWNVLGYAVAP